MKIAIARDEAFNFTYRANIDKLREKGTVTFFSPLKDAQLPDCDFLYLPGGYPELFAEALENNAPMRQSIAEYIEKGGKALAECGGFMYLCKDIDDREMCGVLPFSATMEGAKLHLGYRQMASGRGHEFHYSTIKEIQKMPNGIIVGQSQKSAKGTAVSTKCYRYKNLYAGYTHWYWAEGPLLDEIIEGRLVIR